MAKVVFILGAGSSAEAGVPCMGNFLDKARNLYDESRVSDQNVFKEVFDGISVLQSVHSKAKLDLNNIESIFSAFEIARILGTFGDYSTDRIELMTQSISSLIAETIDLTFRDNGHVAGYEALGHLLRDLKTRGPARSVAVITFNYDVGCDLAALAAETGADYGLESTQPINGTQIPILKLHGSIAWRNCTRCNKIVPIESDFANALRALKPHCGEPTPKKPVLIPPTFSKGRPSDQIAHVWSRAAAELSQAEDIFVCGYSLPPSDSFFPFLYALGSVGVAVLRRFWVFDIERSVEARFRDLLGPGASPKFRFSQKKFTEAIPIIRGELRR